MRDSDYICVCVCVKDTKDTLPSIFLWLKKQQYKNPFFSKQVIFTYLKVSLFN